MKFSVINSIRTNNFADEQCVEKINSLWAEASRQLVGQNTVLYGVYYDYESDYKGDYTLAVAVEGSEGEALVELSEHANYEIFKVDEADELSVVRAWQNIWEREQEGTLRRAYTWDFEKYSPNGNTEIYIAIL
ncbi:GyrI-like domain-containing protein [Paenibacillus sp. NPDC058071]|uniref:GyrI-like domain-containing protein n=1 Tax=Paenibacillus sp. NPDC058071 TaxID=3346326 RepID=UPI0036DEFC71